MSANICAGCDRSVESGDVSWKDCEPYCQECRANGYRAATVLIVPPTDAESILARIADMQPRTWSDEGLSDACFFCGEHQEERCTYQAKPGSYLPGIVRTCSGTWQLHQSRCPWVAARRLFDRPVYVCTHCDKEPKREFPFTPTDDWIEGTATDAPAPLVAIEAASTSPPIQEPGQ